MKLKDFTGKYCEVYGNTLDNQILEYLLEASDVDIAIGDMAKELGISKPKAYAVMAAFGSKGWINKTRLVGKTQMYHLNKDNTIVKIFLRNFDECLHMVVRENTSRKESKVRIG